MTGETPVTVVTGFLGSGKTTLINGLLGHPGMAETAVIANEFGEIGFDHLLVEHIDEATVLIGAGCLCCATRDDLAAALAGLLARREAGAVPPFRRVLIETSGLADPAPILHTLLADERASGSCRVEGIVATVDALLGAARLERRDESLRQAAMADRLALTKIDLAGPEAAASLRARLAEINEDAPVFEAPVAPDDLFAAPGPDAEAERTRRWLAAPDRAHHDAAIQTFSLTADEPLHADHAVAWIDAILAAHGDRLLRLKGIFDLEGGDAPVAVHGVQHVFHPLRRLAAWPEGPRRSRVVLIGRDLPRDEIERAFAAMRRGARRSW